jgi:hypothetical protein
LIERKAEMKSIGGYSARGLFQDITPTFFLIFIMGVVESIWVHSALRPPVGPLCQPRVIMMMEKLVE